MRERVRHARMPSTGLGRDAEGCCSVGRGHGRHMCLRDVAKGRPPAPRHFSKPPLPRPGAGEGAARPRIRHGFGEGHRGMLWQWGGAWTSPVPPGCGKRPAPGPAALFEASAASAGRGRGCGTPACPPRAWGGTPRDAAAWGGHGRHLCLRGCGKRPAPGPKALFEVSAARPDAGEGAAPPHALHGFGEGRRGMLQREGGHGHRLCLDTG